MLASVLQFIFDNPLGKLAAAVAALLSFVGLFMWHERSVGAEQVRTQIERKANENIRKATAVRGASERGDAGGVLDPHASTH
jgi:hypothetical protein